MLPFRPGKVPNKVKVGVLLHIDTLHIQHFLCEIVFHDLVYVKKRDHIENLLFFHYNELVENKFVFFFFLEES